MSDAEPIMLSALQHRSCCSRQCVLIHVEQAFEQNVHTQRGNTVHERVDEPGFEEKTGVRVEHTGQRVRKSVFECSVNQMQYEDLERQLLAEIDERVDDLRLYRLTEPVELHVKEYGNFRAVDFEAPLIV